MEKNLVESLEEMFPDKAKEVASIVESMVDQAKENLEKEYSEKLEEAYEQLAAEKAALSESQSETEKIAYKGYEQAAAIINDLKSRLSRQASEFEAKLEHEYEEAYKVILDERTKRQNLEKELYEQFDQKLNEMRSFIIERVHEFLELQGTEFYESAKRDVLNDPQMTENRLIVSKIVETVSDHLSDEDLAFAASARVEESSKAIEDMKAQLRILEAKNIRIASENTKLHEALKETKEVLKEHVTLMESEKEKGRKASAINSEGKGKIISENIIVEDTGSERPKVVNENVSEANSDLLRLAGVKK